MSSTAQSPPTEPAADAAQRRIAVLRSEIAADSDERRSAVLRYEVGHLLETRVKNDSMAVKEYLAAFSADATFRAPLFALIRLFERRRSYKNLERLYEAEARSATWVGDRASALVDRAVLLEDHLQDPASAFPLFEEAIEADGTSLAAALMLERQARGVPDPTSTQRAVEVRALQTGDAVLRSLLLVELALDKEANGDIEGAFETFRQTAALPAGRARALAHMERVARKHGRTGELIQALEAQATLASAAARGENQGQDSGAFSTGRFSDQSRAASHAATLLYEAARLRIVHHADVEGAIKDLGEAVALKPDDVLLRQEHMLACEMNGDIQSAAGEARVLIDQGVSGRIAASMHFRLAELAQTNQEADGAREALTAALEADPDSAAAAALLDDLLIDQGRHEERIGHLEARAARLQGEARVRPLWRAAQITAARLEDITRAEALYAQAAESSDDPAVKTALRRELYGAAQRLAATEIAQQAGTALVDSEIDASERSAILRDLYELAAFVQTDSAGALRIVARALDDECAGRWAADAARIRAAAAGDHELVARAHEALAHRSTDDESTAAHLCAAARAKVRGGDPDGAVTALRTALEHSASHSYALSMLEEILQARGDAAEVVDLLRGAASAQAGATAAEDSLLTAAAAAEASGDSALAAKTFKDAVAQDPSAETPLLALERLARTERNAAWLREALEGLAMREGLMGEADRCTLELAELDDFVAGDAAKALAKYAAAFDSTQVGTEAAMAALLVPEAMGAHREQAASTLLTRVQPAKAPLITRILGMESGSRQQKEQAARALLDRDSRNLWAAWTLLECAGTAADARAFGWAALAGATSDESVAAELSLFALRSKALSEDEDAADDAFLMAQELAASDGDSAAAGVALDETVSGGDDPDSRLAALQARLEQASPDTATALAGATARAMLTCGHSAEAMAAAKKAVEQRPEDLAAWETLRVAARLELSWTDVLNACDMLAQQATGEARAQLLEEAGAVLMDELGEDAEAERRLRAALEDDVRRPISSGRLRDLLSEQEETGALLDMVSRRINAEDDPTELVGLYYEQARLSRGNEDLPAALEALGHLLMLEPGHVGGLALKVEIHVASQQWRQAVDALRALAAADVPASQKRLALMGAADFLEKHLGDPKAALAQLDQVVALGQGDANVFARAAAIAESASMAQEAVAALAKAAEVSEGATRAGFERRAGRLLGQALRDPKGATAAFGRALAAEPTDLEAAEAMAELVVDPVDRAELAERFETAVRGELDRSPADEDALRKLRFAASWRGDADLELRALGVLVALGLGLPEEEDAFDALVAGIRPIPSSPVADFAALRADGDAGPVARLAAAAREAVADADRLVPGTYGVGRAELVRKDSALLDELRALVDSLGLPLTELYVGGTDPVLIAAVPTKKGAAWIVGSQVASPLSAAQRFVVGQLTTAVRMGTLSFVQRRTDQAATMLYAAAGAANAAVPGAETRSGYAELTQALTKAMGRKARKGVSEAAAALPPDANAIENWCQAATQTALRGGLLLAGDLEVALGAVLGGAGDAVTSPAARGLVQFWVSPQAKTLRRELGVHK